jgi:predicted nucleic acid-binding Zn ribbon protein
MFLGSKNKKALQIISAVVGVLVMISMVLMYAVGSLVR